MLLFAMGDRGCGYFFVFDFVEMIEYFFLEVGSPGVVMIAFD